MGCILMYDKIWVNCKKEIIFNEEMTKCSEGIHLRFVFMYDV